jgi:hypothetical protein
MKDQQFSLAMMIFQDPASPLEVLPIVQSDKGRTNRVWQTRTAVEAAIILSGGRGCGQRFLTRSNVTC